MDGVAAGFSINAPRGDRTEMILEAAREANAGEGRLAEVS